MMVWVVLGLFGALYCLIEWCYAKYWDANLSVDVFLPSENVHEGETGYVTEVIVNDKWLMIPILETFFQLDKGLRYQSSENASVSDKLYRRDVFALAMKQKISRVFPIICTKRGYYTLDAIEMMSSDVFLRKKFLAKKQMFSSFHVYPRRVRSEQIALPYRRLMGELLLHKRLDSDPFSFGGMRSYTNTDPMNTINWGASAKSQELIVNLYDSSVDQKVLLLLDTSQNDTTAEQALNEESIRIVSALAERLLRQGIEVSVLGNAADCRTGEYLHLPNINGQSPTLVKEHLARVKLGQETQVTSLFAQIPSDAFVVVVSKNAALQYQLKAQMQSFLWVLPYQHQLPEVDAAKAECVFWQYKTGNLQENHA